MTPIKIIVNVLDDQQYILDLIKQMFDELPEYEVYYFTDPFKFESSLSSEVDLVITDIRVGGGYDALQTIKKINDDSPSTLIFVISQYLDVPFMQKLQRLRVNDTILKTSEPEIWLAQIKDCLLYWHKRLYDRAEIKQRFYDQ